MKEAALILSGGGAKGAFQVGALKYAREVKDYRWTIISGVSIGALNGAFLAMGAHDRLERLWRKVTRNDIFRSRMYRFGEVLRLWDESIYDNAPLREMVEREIDPSRFRIPIMIGAVSVRTGRSVTFTDKSEVPFKEALMASMALPVFFPAEEIEGYGRLVDGGIRGVAPFADIIASEPDEIVAINCGPWDIDDRADAAPNSLRMAGRAFEIMMNEIVMSDVRELLRVNRMVEQAAREGYVLTSEKGRPYRRFECRVIQPESSLGETLDFSRKTLDRNWERGWEAAKKALG